jgi:hypothetical protein
MSAGREMMAGMSGQQTFHPGQRVEVWRDSIKDWIGGDVYQSRVRADGDTEYFVQLSGTMAMQADDPSSWFTADKMRPAHP